MSSMVERMYEAAGMKAPIKTSSMVERMYEAAGIDIAPVRTTDIAPVKKKKDKKMEFFQKGAFSDGYQVGDVTKTILGTVGDVGAGVIKGVGRMGEGVLDLVNYGAAGIADFAGDEKLAEAWRRNAKRDAVGDAFKSTDEWLDQYSLLGKTADSIAEGLGQVGAVILTGGLAGAAGLGAAGATAATTGAMGLSSFGSGMSEAYEGGATDKEAATYGLIKGVVDAGSELIFGGLGKTVKALGLSKGISSLDDAFAQKLTSKIANQTYKNLVQFGVKASAEGVEEVLAGIGTAVGKKLTYMEDEELKQLVKDENLFEQFIVGAVTSGIAQSGIVPGMRSGSLMEANKTGRDFITGLPMQANETPTKSPTTERETSPPTSDTLEAKNARGAVKTPLREVPEIITKTAEKYGDGSQDFMDAHNSERQDATEYAAAFDTVYRAAQEGLPKERAQDIKAADRLTPKQFSMAYEMGVNANKTTRKEKVINNLTGEEITEETYRALDRLAAGEDVSDEELGNLKEVVEGREHLSQITKDFIAQHPGLADVDEQNVGTHLISTEERQAMREKIIAERLKSKSCSSIDSKGKAEYNGSVEKGKRIDIVIGVPASGKSSAIVNPISLKHHSMIIDSDIIKEMLPEYDGGWGASLVHKESSQINRELLTRALEEGNNIVLPIVGSKVSSVEDYIEAAKANGYSINLHLNEIPNSKAVGRTLRRYFYEGRFIDPKIVAEYGNRPSEVYEQLKNRSEIDEYSHWDNDVAFGESARQRDGGKNNRLAEAGLRRSGRGDVAVSAGVRSTETSGEIATDDLIEPIKASSEDGVFFDAENAQVDIVPVRADITQAADPISEDITPVAEQYTNEAPIGEGVVQEDTGDKKGKQRKWVKTSTESDVVDGKVLPDDLDQEAIHYQPISNKATLGNANKKLHSLGYKDAVTYFNGQFTNKRVSLDDIALGERLIQDAIARGDTKTAGELIQNVAILGTELGQKVQALSIIKRLTPEGQLRMLQKVVERGKSKGDKAFDGVDITQEMADKILNTYNGDGTYDQDALNAAVEEVKQEIADQMKVSGMDRVNAWRYLSMLGNPKTHLRNLISNVAMKGTMAVKNSVARHIESIAPIKSRTRTFRRASDEVKAFAKNKAVEMKDDIQGNNRYSENASIKEKRKIFKREFLNKLYGINNEWLSKEDWWFSKSAFSNSLSEFLTANGISTQEDIDNNPDLVGKGIRYATEQSEIATFRQYSWIASKIGEIEHKNTATEMVVGAVLPFKKTPINIAKAGLNYSPLGFAKTLTYDISQVKNGNMEASTLVDHLAQNLTGTGLMIVGYMFAKSGLLNGAGEDDKEGEYDYQLGEQKYSINIGDSTFSLSWLSPVAMPLFVGANAYEQLVEGEEWNADVVLQTLAQTLDPLSEMSFISSLDQVLSSYDSGIEKFSGIAQSMVQNYATQFIPTLSSQVATVFDDKKRSTKAAADSGFKFGEETKNKVMYKIPRLRNLLEPTIDIWGNEVEQTENLLVRALETFVSPSSRREDITTDIDEEIKDLYNQTGDTGLFPTIPQNYLKYDDEKYKMSAKEYTAFKKNYGRTASKLLEQLFDTKAYQNADAETQADMVNRVYDYARDEAKRAYYNLHGVKYTNTTKDNVKVYKANPIKGAIEHDMTVDEYKFYADDPGKYSVAKAVGGYASYKTYSGALNDIKADKNSKGESISGSRKKKVIEYVNGLDADYGTRIIIYKSQYSSDDTYNYDILNYLNSRDDLTYDDRVSILKELDFDVDSNGNVTW